MQIFGVLCLLFLGGLLGVAAIAVIAQILWWRKAPVKKSCQNCLHWSLCHELGRDGRLCRHWE